MPGFFDWAGWPAVEAAATALAFIYTARTFHLNVQYKRREQASRVSAVLDSVTPQDDGLLTIDVRVVNHDSSPIFDVYPLLEGIDGANPKPSQPSRVLAGGAHVILSTGDCSPTAPRVGVQFRDSVGRRWTRRVDGALIDGTFAARIVPRTRGQQEVTSRLRRIVNRAAWKVYYLFRPDFEVPASREPVRWSVLSAAIGVVALVAGVIALILGAPWLNSLGRTLATRGGVAAVAILLAAVSAVLLRRSRREDRARNAHEERFAAEMMASFAPIVDGLGKFIAETEEDEERKNDD